MAKKYTVSEAALRRLIKRLVEEEVANQRRSADPFADELQDESWFSLGEPQAVENTKQNQQASFEQEFPGLSEPSPFRPESNNELNTPPFLNSRRKKK